VTTDNFNVNYTNNFVDSLKNVEELPPLLLWSKEQEDEAILARAGHILIPEVTDSQEITPTPAFTVSTVAQQALALVDFQLKAHASAVETKAVNMPDSDSSDMETSGQNMKNSLNDDMIPVKVDTGASIVAQSSSKMVCFLFSVMLAMCDPGRVIPVMSS
jgi:hypothetical protein